MKLKKSDIVKISKGKDAGKSGKILKVYPKEERVTVEGLNLCIKHLRPRRAGEKGQKIQFPVAVRISNVKLVCPKCSRPVRVGYQITEGKKLRQCRKCKVAFS